MKQKSIPVLQREINKLKKTNAEVRGRVMAVPTFAMRQELLDTLFQNEMRIQQLSAEIEEMRESEKKMAEAKAKTKSEETVMEKEEE